MRATAAAPPAHAPAPAVTPAPPRPARRPARRLPASLSAVPAAPASPAVQRACCTSCAEKDEGSRVRPRTAVGPAGDRYEREADDIAGRVMAMREDEADPPETSADPDEDAMARRRGDPTDASEDDQARACGARSGTTLSAAGGELTSGGSPLSDVTRQYFERRMGRDLSAVRVHAGATADHLNRSIHARAFTFRNHVWLGRNETAGRTFTMAHELGHVLQQTTLGPVGPGSGAAQQAASGRDIGVQRSVVAFWEPLGAKASARTRHGKIHDAAQKAIRKANKGIITEVPVPGANARTVSPSVCGFADLYTAEPDNIPGLREAPAADATAGSDRQTTGPAPLGVANFDASSATSCKNAFPFHPTEQDVDSPTQGRRSPGSRRYPKVRKRRGTPAIVGWGKAPGKIRIGEVKPGHNPDYLARGEQQVKNYLSGIRNVAKAANRHAPATGGRHPDPQMLDTLTIPGGWRTTSTTWPIRQLRLRLSSGLPGGSQTFHPWGSRGKKRTTGIRGRWSLAKSRTPGIWAYFLMPNPADLSAALASGNNTAAFKKTGASLTRVLGYLTATPKQAAKVRKRSLPGPAGGVRPRAQRREQAEDVSLDLKTWNRMRGAPKNATPSPKSLKGTLDQHFPEAVQGDILFRAAAVDAIQHAKQHYEGVDALRTPANASQLKDEGRQLGRLQFWSGQPAGIFGVLRKLFGGVFVRVVSAVESLKTKAKKAFQSVRMRGGGGGALAQAAKTAAKSVLRTLGTLIMRKVGTQLRRCLERGFGSFIKQLTAAAGLDQLVEKANVARGMVENLRAKAVENVEKLIGGAIAPIKATVDKVASATAFVGKVVGVGARIARGLRLATCASGAAAGGVGAVATCALSLGDWVASLFGVSPIDYVAGKLVSCGSRKLIARAMLATATLRKLPTQIAQKVAGFLRKNLPDPANQVICADKDLAVDPVAASEFTCSDDGPVGRDDGGGNGGGGEGGAHAGKAGSQEGGGAQKDGSSVEDADDETGPSGDEAKPGAAKGAQPRIRYSSSKGGTPGRSVRQRYVIRAAIDAGRSLGDGPLEVPLTITITGTGRRYQTTQRIVVHDVSEDGSTVTFHFPENFTATRQVLDAKGDVVSETTYSPYAKGQEPGAASERTGTIQ